MADPSEGSTSTAPRGRGRGKRGGLGKYLRARGRRGGGRPAEFRERLVLEGEESGEIDPEEAEEITRKYAKRTIVSSVHRSEPDPEPILNSDGEVEEEPEVDLSSFLERQRLDDTDIHAHVGAEDSDDEDVDESLAYLGQKNNASSKNRKGNMQTIEWDESLEELRKDKESADANRELKSRFRADVEKQKKRQNRPVPTRRILSAEKVEEAPPLPVEAPVKPKSEKEQMEGFLDDLLD